MAGMLELDAPVPPRRGPSSGADRGEPAKAHASRRWLGQRDLRGIVEFIHTQLHEGYGPDADRP